MFTTVKFRVRVRYCFKGYIGCLLLGYHFNLTLNVPHWWNSNQIFKRFETVSTLRVLSLWKHDQSTFFISLRCDNFFNVMLVILFVSHCLLIDAIFRSNRFQISTFFIMSYSITEKIISFICFIGKIFIVRERRC